MIIRKATTKDAKEIATCMMLAMEEIVYKFIGENSTKKALHFLESLIIQKNNQYSYENCWIIEDNNKVIAATNIYNGADLEKLRAPVASVIKTMFNQTLVYEKETQPGEYYIDCIGVNPSFQGKGVGSKILQFLIDEYVHKKNETLGLLVDKDNPNAKKLYLKLGFKVVGKKTLVDKEMEHLQIQ
ncbi:GNAT family N-acetyltransferase [Tenacibaculum sp. 1_MG-2023]|uniref:GNAT family N-acetyltransferase n=1 Tax=Tenacibaculum sp. 1_MG-2023 TaxID=3062653 RepID=UPI0026E20734|nr:GNAT family N-acetyltransferase [Tenacibaculum sp. 1_MG-2023]MDO6674885.1 GNAT family N-acetyltransferase [Tenacibaculum sp. 1_MG-2023]